MSYMFLFDLFLYIYYKIKILLYLEIWYKVISFLKFYYFVYFYWDKIVVWFRV